MVWYILLHDITIERDAYANDDNVDGDNVPLRRLVREGKPLLAMCPMLAPGVKRADSSAWCDTFTTTTTRRPPAATDAEADEEEEEQQHTATHSFRVPIGFLASAAEKGGRREEEIG